MPPPITLTVLISGTGTNLQSLIDATLPNTRITHVISNRKSAPGLARAAAAGIRTTVHNLITGGYTARFPNPSGTKAASPAARAAYDADLAALVLAEPPDVVVMAGWMHIVSPAFLQPLEERGVVMINLHPALPGAYSGAEAIGRAWSDWEQGRISGTGCMVHRVVGEVDMGEPVVVREVEFRAGEERGQFEERFHGVEHEVIVEGTGRVVEEVRKRRKEGT